jgi:hypothetical protein
LFIASRPKSIEAASIYIQRAGLGGAVHGHGAAGLVELAAPYRQAHVVGLEAG